MHENTPNSYLLSLANLTEIFEMLSNIGSLIAATISKICIYSISCDSDDSFHPNDGIATCGQLLRDRCGAFIVGFTCKVVNCSVLQAELWGILHGLKPVLESYSRFLRSSLEILVGYLFIEFMLTDHE